MTFEQLPLDFPVLHSHALDDFFVAASNKEAVRLIEAWPNWPHHLLILTGAKSSGKTHLAHIFENRAKAIWLEGDKLPDTTATGPFIIDNADRLQDQQVLFHIINWSKEIGSQLLLTAASAPPYWNIGLPDLSSRLLAAPSVNIRPPNEALLSAILLKQFADRQIKVDDNVISFLLPRMERSCASALALAKELDKAALKRKRRITIVLAREVLDHFGQDSFL